MRVDWKKATGLYECGENAFCGRWNIGWAGYDGCCSKGDTLKYTSICRLPGIKDRLGRFETNDEAKIALEKAINHWFKCLKAPPTPAPRQGEEGEK